MTREGEQTPCGPKAGAFRLPGHTAGLSLEGPPTPTPADDVLARALPGEPEPLGQPEDREPLEERPSPRIYVASLSDYNDGNLHGAWIDAAQPVDDTWDEIQRMLMASPMPDAEEWAIHDYEGFGALRLGEYEPLEFLHEVAEGIAAYGEAFAAFVDVAERDRDRFPLFEQVYQGHRDSLATYVGELLAETGVQSTLDDLPAWVRDYLRLDLEGLAQSLQSGGVTAVPASEGGVYVFDLEA